MIERSLKSFSLMLMAAMALTLMPSTQANAAVEHDFANHSSQFIFGLFGCCDFCGECDVCCEEDVCDGC